jgi:hypothetical protein
LDVARSELVDKLAWGRHTQFKNIFELFQSRLTTSDSASLKLPSLTNTIVPFRQWRKIMSTIHITSTPRVVIASWIVIALVGAAIIVCAVVASLYGSGAETEVLFGP